LAAYYGKLEVARELISKGADIEAKDKVRGAEGAIDECCRWRLVERERREGDGTDARHKMTGGEGEGAGGGGVCFAL